MNTSNDTFLGKVAARIVQDHRQAMQDVCVVLPNRRAGIFLKRCLSSHFELPVFAPAVFSIEDFVFEHVGLNHTDQLILLWELYQCYLRTSENDVRSFEEFLKWGRILLQDFEEIDLHLIDAQSLFTYLSDAKAIELWNPGKPELTSGQQNYLTFYRSLKELYGVFKEHLLSQRMAYNGLAFRKLSEQNSAFFSELSWNDFYFVGFNAFSPTERKIIDLISDSKNVVNLYDSDSYYLNDTKQEAGKYLRETLKYSKTGAFEWVGDSLLEGSKSIEVIGSSHNIGQTLVAGSILESLGISQAENTALILNDESLLIPMLNMIPDNIGEFNITMGFPFSLTPAYSLLEILLSLHLNAIERSRKDHDSTSDKLSLRFYFRDISGLLKHPFILKFLSIQMVEPNMVQELLNQCKVYFAVGDIFNAFESNEEVISLFELIFCDWKEIDDIVDKLLRISSVLFSAFYSNDTDQAPTLDLEFLGNFSLIINRLKFLTCKDNFNISLKGLQQLIRTIAASTKIPFTGEPLKGLQIMGMLETRTLDFENIIILGMNDDLLPAVKNLQTFVPFDIRREFGLPLGNDKEAVFAYHFYRLLQRCNNIYLLYNTTADGLGGGEKSRYILQIEHELTKVNPNISYVEKFYSPPVKFDMAMKEISVEKTADVMADLENMAISGFSPTALSNFITCSLKFYFTYILKLGEEDLVDDSMDSLTFGIGMHDTLQELYSPYKGVTLTAKILDKIASFANDTLHRCFLKAYNNNDIDYGRNLLMVKVAESYLRRFVSLEKEFISELASENKQLVIEEIEVEINKIKPVFIKITYKGNRDFPVRIRGKADRIDKIGSQVRIIDFKTGSLADSELSVKSWDILLTAAKKEKAFQLATYAFLYAKTFNTELPESGIISFRNLNNGFKKVKLPADNSDAVSQIELLLQQLIERIFNTDEPFTQTTESDSCKYCQFKSICSR